MKPPSVRYRVLPRSKVCRIIRLMASYSRLMICSWMRLLPEVSTMSRMREYSSTNRTPYSAWSAVSTKNTWVTSTRASTTYRVPEMGRPSFLFRITATISVPPVEAPWRRMTPMPTPKASPANSRHRKGSSVRGPVRSARRLVRENRAG